LVHQRGYWCRYLRFKLVVAAEDHGFCDGASHQRKDPYRDEGVSLKEALVRAFAQGRPTAAAKKRQKR
jgi:hypothetical protein